MQFFQTLFYGLYGGIEVFLLQCIVQEPAFEGARGQIDASFQQCVEEGPEALIIGGGGGCEVGDGMIAEMDADHGP